MFVFLTARAKKTFLKRFPGRAKKTFLLYFAGPSPPPSPYTFKVDTYTSDPRAASSTLKHAGGGGADEERFCSLDPVADAITKWCRQTQGLIPHMKFEWPYDDPRECPESE